MTVADGSGEAAALDDHAVALDVAHRAGEMLVDLIHTPDLDRRWGGLEYEGDARAHRFIMSELRRMRPDDAILSEEGADDCDDRCADAGAVGTWAEGEGAGRDFIRFSGCDGGGATRQDVDRRIATGLARSSDLSATPAFRRGAGAYEATDLRGDW